MNSPHSDKTVYRAKCPMLAEALFIAQHESQFDPTTMGDTDKTCADGSTMRSRGLWQINSCAWPEINDATAFSVVSSTEWAMIHINENPDIWSAWLHKNWYSEKL
jgi:Lysozyme like domain